MKSQIRIIMEAVFNDLTERFGDPLETPKLPEFEITHYETGLAKTIYQALEDHQHRDPWYLRSAIFSAVYAWTIGGMKASEVSPRNTGSVIIQEIFKAGMLYQKKIDTEKDDSDGPDDS